MCSSDLEEACEDVETYPSEILDDIVSALSFREVTVPMNSPVVPVMVTPDVTITTTVTTVIPEQSTQDLEPANNRDEAEKSVLCNGCL